jgi:hypothetical protein
VFWSAATLPFCFFAAPNSSSYCLRLSFCTSYLKNEYRISLQKDEYDEMGTRRRCLSKDIDLASTQRRGHCFNNHNQFISNAQNATTPNPQQHTLHRKFCPAPRFRSRLQTS